MKKNPEKRIALLFLAFSLMLLLAGCQDQEAVIPAPLLIRGDVMEEIAVGQFWNDMEKQEVEWNGETVMGGDMVSIIGEQSLYSDYDLVLVAGDGFMVRLDGDTISDTYLGYDDSRQWFYMSDKHPVNSRVKNIKEMILVKDQGQEPDFDSGVNLIVSEENHHFSLGQLMVMDHGVMMQTDGVSRSGDLAIEVMKQKHVVALEDLMEIGEGRALIASRDGDLIYEPVKGGLLEVENGGVNYRRPGSNEVVRDIVGIMLDPPFVSNMDAFYDARYYMDKEIPVLVIFLDGFSYGEYRTLCLNHPDYYLAGLPEFNRAASVYRPVTNAGFAAMVTGQPPAVNGIHDRSGRDLACDSIFDLAEARGMETLLIEGEIKILDLPGETILNLDLNENGTSDDEAFEAARNKLDPDKYAYSMVHFHSIDDAGHIAGPQGDLTWERIAMIDGYVGQLVENWPGAVMITADHGMHQEGETGSHWNFRAEDVTIPYLTLQGGQSNEQAE